MRGVFVVKRCEGKAKFRAKFLEGYFGAIRLCQDIVRGFPDRGQIIHERPGPVEDNIANHEAKLTMGAQSYKANFLCALILGR